MTCRFLSSLALMTISCLAADINLWVDDSTGMIGLVDVTPGPNLGKVTLVGQSGVVLGDIAFDPNGQLFGVGPVALNPPYNLYRWSALSGAASSIGVLRPTINPVPCGANIVRQIRWYSAIRECCTR